MSEEKLEMQEDLKGGSRRSRKDEQGRDYICGCGKKYLSYPALYTHIKTKHEGHQPEGTQKTGLAPLKSRTKQRLDDKLVKEIQTWVDMGHLKILELLDENAIGSISSSSRIKREAVGKEIWGQFNELVKNPVLALDQTSPLDQVLVVYLLAVGQYVSEPMFYYYCQFARLFRQSFAEGIEAVLSNVFKTYTPSPNSAEECKLAPLMCDYFLRYYLCLEVRDHDFMSLMQGLTCDFCQWMYSKKLTPVEINMAVKYSLPRRDLIQPKIKEKKGDLKNDKDDDKDDSQDPQHSTPDDSDKKHSEIDGQMVSPGEAVQSESEGRVPDGSMIAEI